MTDPEARTQAKIRAAVLLEYRGLCIVTSEPNKSLVSGYAWKADYQLLRRCTSPVAHTLTPLQEVVDRWWSGGEVDTSVCESTDGIPWEIHQISDLTARQEAYAAFKATSHPPNEPEPNPTELDET